VAETNGLLNRRACHVNDHPAETSEPSSVELGVLLGVLERECPELAAIVAAWADLPEPIRKAIITLVESVRDNESAT